MGHRHAAAVLPRRRLRRERRLRRGHRRSRWTQGVAAEVTTRREQVFRAIECTGPDYVPIYLFNKDEDQSDVVAIGVQHHFMGPKADVSEWGFRWQRLDETMGQPDAPVLGSSEDVDSLQVPELRPDWRFADVPAFVERYADSYRLGALGLSGFTTMSCLRAFDGLMEDMALCPDAVEALADAVFGFEEEIIAAMAGRGLDAVAFGDDWGTQQGLIISPPSWRRIFKPRYAAQFALAHQHGMHVYFHCCGKIDPIIPDMIEIGVDLLNLSQPNLYDIPELGRRYGGRVCFVCPVSYQTTSILGTPKEIYEDVRALVEHLGGFNGGLVGYVEEYHTIGMSDANYAACVEAFRSLGRYNRSAAQD